MISAFAVLSLLAGPASAGPAVVWLSPDVYVLEGAEPPKRPATGFEPSREDCLRAVRSRLACTRELGKRPEPCGADADRLAGALRAAIEGFPEALTGAFCAVGSFLIIDEYDGTAFAGDHGDAYNIGLKRSVLDRGLSLRDWASWKEQLAFGGSKKGYSTRPGLPVVDAPGGALRFVLAHELGHILDFQKGLNPSYRAAKTTPLSPEGWTYLSWLNLETTVWKAVFPNRERLGFYDGTELKARDIEPTYAQLALTDFVSLYAATNPWDDFAETIAHRVLVREGGTVVVRRPAGGEVDSARRFAEPLLARKTAFVDRLLAEGERSAAIASSARRAASAAALPQF